MPRDTRNPGPETSQKAEQKPRSGAPVDTQTGRHAPTARDSITMSNKRDKTDLTELERRITEQPAIDTRRVEAVQAAIKSGAYRIDSAAVAKKLIDIYHGPGEPEDS